jgi:hypothetical protein
LEIILASGGDSTVTARVVESLPQALTATTLISPILPKAPETTFIELTPKPLSDEEADHPPGMDHVYVVPVTGVTEYVNDEAGQDDAGPVIADTSAVFISVTVTVNLDALSHPTV